MERILDVSALEPCEPMERTLQAVTALGDGEFLRVIHRREPHLLYPVLERMGCAWHTRPGGVSEYEIFIWKSTDRAAASAAALQTNA